MKIKHIALMGAALLAASAFMSCTQEPMMKIPAEEAYARAFIRQFGLIDPAQDWNLAEQQNVTVTLPAPSEVKVHARIDGAFYLVADYENVSGTRQIFFDVPEGTKDLKVTACGQRFDATVGSSVDFTNSAMSRTSSSTTTSLGNIVVTDLINYDTDNANWLRMPHDGALQYRNIVPEFKDNRDNKGINKNFLYESNGPFVIHPIYWHTNQTNTLGIYFHCTSSEVGAEKIYDYDLCDYIYVKKIDVYTIKSDNDILFYADYSKVQESERETINSLSGDPTDFVKKNSEAWRPVGNVTSMGENLLDGNKNVQLMSKGIKVDIPKGMVFGMYINSSNGYVYYSESSLNRDPYIEREYPEGGDKHQGTATSATQMPWQACHAASFYGDLGGLALLFEDWPDSNGTSGADMDLNDMVFVFFGADPKNITGNVPVIKPTEEVYDIPYGWIIAAEDLGVTDDFDFNDVVVGIEYVSGQTKAQLTALAAGGTLPIKLMYDGKVVKSFDNKDQFHNWFVGDPETSEMINTRSITYNCKGKVEIDVPADWSISTYADGKMGGFSLEVERADGTFYDIEAPGTGAPPQMICVPGGWGWPKERYDIREAYLDFSKWVNDANAYSEWYKTNYVKENLVKEPKYKSDEPTTPGGSTGPSQGNPGGSGEEFSVPAPTVEANGERIAAAGPNGYLQIEIDLKELTDASTLYKSVKYLQSFPNDDNYKQYVINALMAHYWNKVFYAPAENETDKLVYPSYGSGGGYYYGSGDKFGAGKTFKLMDVMSIIESSFKVVDQAEEGYAVGSIKAKVKIFAHVKQIESDGNTPDPSDPDPATVTYIDLTVTEVGASAWGGIDYKVTAPEGVTLSIGDKVKITTSATTIDVGIAYGRIGTDVYKEEAKLQNLTDGIFTIGQGFNFNRELFIADWKSGVITAQKVVEE